MYRRLSQNDALDELKEMLAADAHPKLTDPQVLRLLDTYRVKDRDGNRPDHADWSPTYELDAAAAEGWRRKAALVAGDYDFGADRSQLSRSQVRKACMEMSQEFTKKVAPTFSKINQAVRRNDRLADWEALIDAEAEEI